MIAEWGAGATWTAHAFRDRRGRYPVVDFLEQQNPRDRALVRNKIRVLLEMLVHQPPHTIGRPLVDTLRGPIKELRATRQIRVLFSWEAEGQVMLFLEGERKKGRSIDRAVLERAEAHRAEWKMTKSSDPIDEIT